MQLLLYERFDSGDYRDRLWVTQKWLLPNLGKYEGSVKVEAYRPLSRKERRALMVAVTVAGIYVARLFCGLLSLPMVSCVALTEV